MKNLPKSGLIFLTAILLSQASLAKKSTYDLSGFRFIDSNEEGGPIYNYRDITDSSESYNEMSEFYSSISLEFDFTFNGENINALTINPNGALTLSSNGSNNRNNIFGETIPMQSGSAENTPFLAPFYSNLSLKQQGKISYSRRNSSEDRQFVVQYNTFHAFDELNKPLDFQVILNASDNSIVYQYKTIRNNSFGDSGSNATVGIQNSSTQGLGYSANEAMLEDRLAIRFEEAEKYIGTDKPSGSSTSGLPGETVTHSIQIKNETGQDRNFVFSAEGADWAVQLPNSPISIDNTAVVTVNIEVIIDNETALQSLSDTFILKVASTAIDNNPANEIDDIYLSEIPITTETMLIQQLTQFDIPSADVFAVLSDDADTVMALEQSASETPFKLYNIDTFSGSMSRLTDYQASDNFYISYAEESDEVFFTANNAVFDQKETTLYYTAKGDENPRAIISTELELNNYANYTRLASSADGNVLAFVSNLGWDGENSNNHINLFIIRDKEPDSLEKIINFNDTFNDEAYYQESVKVSADGSTIVFTSIANGIDENAINDEGNSNLKLYVYDVNLNTISLISPKHLNIKYFDISASGEDIVFVAEDYDGGDYQFENIYKVKREGQEFEALNTPIALANYNSISLSGDGTTLAFAANASLLRPWEYQYYSEIFTMDFDGNNLQQITSYVDTEEVESYFTIANPDISFDGRHLMFRSNAQILDTNESAITQLYLIDLNPFAEVLVTEPEPQPEIEVSLISDTVIEPAPRTENPEVLDNGSCSPQPYCDTSGSMNPYGLAVMLSLLLLRLKKKPSELKNEGTTQTNNAPCQPQHKALLLTLALSAPSLTMAADTEIVWETIADAKSSPAVYIDAGKAGASIGDQYIFDQPLLDKQGQNIGSNSGYCIRTKLNHSVQCQWTLSLANGTIQLAGREFDQGDSWIPIIGGSGQYLGMTGVMRSFKNADGRFTQVLHYQLP